MSLDTHIGDDLTLFLFNDPLISDARRKEIRDHLDICERCRAMVQDSERVVRACDDQPALVPSPAFSRAVHARLDAIDARAEPWWSGLLRTFFRPTTALATAFAVAGIILVATLVRGTNDELPLPLVADPFFSEASDPSETIEFAERLEMLKDFSTVEHFDIADDLEFIVEVDEGVSG